MTSQEGHTGIVGTDTNMAPETLFEAAFCELSFQENFRMGQNENPTHCPVK
jgi:hypothetical protein